MHHTIGHGDRWVERDQRGRRPDSRSELLHGHGPGHREGPRHLRRTAPPTSTTSSASTRPDAPRSTFERVDRGDAPTSYSGASSDDGPAHKVDLDAATGDPELTLGDKVDYELQAAPNAAADGRRRQRARTTRTASRRRSHATTGLKFDATVKATNRTSGAATLAGWLDLDGNGTFEQSERVVVPVPAGSSATPFTLHFGAPSTTTATYARFRLFNGDVSDPSPTGTVSGGEVEDYRVSVDVLLPTVTCTSDAQMFNTAYNGSGGKLSPGARDLHWETGLGNATGPSSVTTYIPAYVVTRNPAWYAGAFGSAAWIGNTPSAAHAGNVDLYFRYRFNIDAGVTLDNFVLPMSFFADNSVPDVWVNGVSQDPFQDSLPQSPTNPYFYAGFVQANAAKTELTQGSSTARTRSWCESRAGRRLSGSWPRWLPTPCATTEATRLTATARRGATGASHALKDFTGTNKTKLMLGDTVDADGAAQPGAAADGDDNSGVDDEDGVAAAIKMALGEPTTVRRQRHERHRRRGHVGRLARPRW